MREKIKKISMIIGIILMAFGGLYATVYGVLSQVGSGSSGLLRSAIICFIIFVIGGIIMLLYLINFIIENKDDKQILTLTLGIIFLVPAAVLAILFSYIYQEKMIIPWALILISIILAICGGCLIIIPRITGLLDWIKENHMIIIIIIGAGLTLIGLWPIFQYLNTKYNKDFTEYPPADSYLVSYILIPIGIIIIAIWISICIIKIKNYYKLRGEIRN